MCSTDQLASTFNTYLLVFAEEHQGRPPEVAWPLAPLAVLLQLVQDRQWVQLSRTSRPHD